MKNLLLAPLLLLALPAHAQINAGNLPATDALPFKVTQIALFDHPWKIAFLPSGGMLVTEKVGKLWTVDGKGAKREVSGVPPVAYKGQGGLLGVFTAPTFAKDKGIYLTYSEPGPGGSGLALAHATYDAKASRLDGLKVVWRQLPRGQGGQFGAYVAFAPDGKSLFLASGERQRFTPAQDPNDALGKILHLTLDGKPAPDNPFAGKTGAETVRVFDPPKDTEIGKTVAGVPGKTASPNLTPSETWSSGHRNPYGLAFDKAGRLWEVEMGPKGGDELNLIEKGGNYGWPIVSYGTNYDGVAISSPDAHPEFKKPAVYWNPVISPGGFTFYSGKLFPKWTGSAFIGALSGTGLVRITFDGTKAQQAERFNLGYRVREVMTGPDGALWILADGERGGVGKLLKLTPQ